MKFKNNLSTLANTYIIKEYEASYTYHLLSTYFGRDNVGLNKLNLLLEKYGENLSVRYSEIESIETIKYFV